MMSLYLATCNPGLEDVCAREVQEEIPEASIEEIREYKGRVIFTAPGDEYTMSRLLSLRSIHSVSLLIIEARVLKSGRGLQEIGRVVSGSNAWSLIPLSASFAVRAQRIGEGHEYTSQDVARTVGDAIAHSYKEKYGYPPLVRLNSPGVVFHAEVDEDIFRLGVQLGSEESLHRRHYRLYDHPAALKPSIAYSMLRLAGIRDSSVILDPMCGGGTIAIEAALLYENAEIICSDWSQKHIEGAKLNAVLARVDRRIRFIVEDARRLPRLLGESTVDAIVTNPPYGIRLGSPRRVRRMYPEILRALYAVLRPGGVFAVITPDSAVFDREARRAGFLGLHARKVRHGDLWAAILVYRKP